MLSLSKMNFVRDFVPVDSWKEEVAGMLHNHSMH